MSDPSVVHGPSRLDLIKAFVADLARPFTLYAMGFSGAWATIVVSAKASNGNDGAWVLGAIGATVSALYAGKALEVANVSKHAAEVEKVRATASPPPDTALQPAAPSAPEADDDPTMFGGPRI